MSAQWLESLVHSSAQQIDDDNDESSIDLRRFSLVESLAAFSLEESESELERQHHLTPTADQTNSTLTSDVQYQETTTSTDTKPIDDAEALRQVFKLKPEDKAICTFKANVVDVTLLTARVLLTQSHLYLFAALQNATEQGKSGFLSIGNKKYWCVIENDALCAYTDRDPKARAYAPVFRKALVDIVDVSPMAATSAHQVSSDDNNDNETAAHEALLDSGRFRVKMAVEFDSLAFIASSGADMRAWVVALRVAAHAARSPTLKRAIPLTSITSMHAPVNEKDFVFGGRCVTLTIGREAEQLWLVAISDDVQDALEKLSNAWLERIQATDATALVEESPDLAHPLQQVFEETFKLGEDEELRHTSNVSLVLKSGLLVRAQLFLSDHAVCVLSNSMWEKLLAVIPWHSATAVTDKSHLLMRGVQISVTGDRNIMLVLPTSHKAMRETIRSMWNTGRTAPSKIKATIEDSDGGADDHDDHLDSEVFSAPRFHSKRDKAFHARFGGDIPIDQSLLQVFPCALLRSDAKHSGDLHVTQSYFAFSSGDDMIAVIPRRSVADSKLAHEDSVLIACTDGSEFHFRFEQGADAFLAVVRHTDSDTASRGDTAVHFYHNQLTAYRRMFSLSQDELLDTHSCSFVRAKLLSLPQSGVLYVGRHNLCFKASFSNFKIVVPIADVSLVDRQESISMRRDGLRLQTTSGAFFLFVGFAALKKTIRQLQKAAVSYRNSQAIAASVAVGGTSPESALASNMTRDAAPMATVVPVHAMRIVILTIGSRGDVQPTIMLGRALLADGHDITIATHAEFKEFVEKNGLKHATLAGDPKALMNLCVSKGMFTPAFVREALGNFRQFIDDLLRSAYKVVKELKPDLMIQAPTVFAGKHISEALHVPLINWFTMPHTPTVRFAHPFAVSNMPIGASTYNYLSFIAVRHALWQPLSGQLNRFREEIGLAPLTRAEGPALNDDVPIMYCFSRHIVPKPAEWQSWVHITGFWLDETQSNANWVPPQPLADFLATGEPPVYIGFGSITGINDVEAFFDKVIQGIELSKERVILLTGWANLGAGRKMSDRIHVLESVPHDWLFPRCKAVVHHGGAGTVATGLRAACPTVVVAFFADQFFWASRVVELGVGHAFTAADLDAERFGAAIADAASNPEMKKRATAISTQLAEEHGVPNAKRVIYDIVQRSKFEKQLVGASRPSTTTSTGGSGHRGHRKSTNEK